MRVIASKEKLVVKEGGIIFEKAGLYLKTS